MKTTDLAHTYWKEILKEGDLAIDATVGNGQDTLVLAKLLHGKGEVVGFDIQECAIERAKVLLKDYGVTLYQKSHEELGQRSPKLIVYNLGYLPGGDKSVTTLCETTLRSLKRASQIVQKGGALSIMCYPGHEEGAKEEKMVLEWAKELPSKEWSVVEHRLINRQKAPTLVLIWRH